MLISLAIPTRNSQLFIDSLITKIKKIVVGRTENFEVILVDDASSDDTINTIVRRVSGFNSPNVSFRVLQNYVKMGQQKNSLIALRHANGDKIFLVEDDMNIEANVIDIFLNAENSIHRTDLLIGTKKKSEHSRLSSWFFWLVLNIISRGEIPRREMLLRMFTKNSLELLLENGQANWTVTENCHRLFSRKTYIELDLVTYLKQSSRHSFLNRLSLAAAICLRYVRLKALGVMTMSFVTLSSLLVILFLLSGIIKDVENGIAFTLASLIFCASGSLVSVNLHQMLIDTALPCKSLPKPKEVLIPRS